MSKRQGAFKTLEGQAVETGSLDWAELSTQELLSQLERPSGVHPIMDLDGMRFLVQAAPLRVSDVDGAFEVGEPMVFVVSGDAIGILREASISLGLPSELLPGLSPTVTSDCADDEWIIDPLSLACVEHEIAPESHLRVAQTPCAEPAELDDADLVADAEEPEAKAENPSAQTPTTMPPPSNDTINRAISDWHRQVPPLPGPVAADPEETLAGLATAQKLWDCGLYSPALRWVRRAAVAAGDAGLTARMAELASYAADVTPVVDSGAHRLTTKGPHRIAT